MLRPAGSVAHIKPVEFFFSREQLLKRKIAVVTSSRADYAHLRWLLHDLTLQPAIELHVIAMGPHHSPAFGHTGKEISAARITAVECLLDSDTDVGMAKTIG